MENEYLKKEAFSDIDIPGYVRIQREDDSIEWQNAKGWLGEKECCIVTIYVSPPDYDKIKCFAFTNTRGLKISELPIEKMGDSKAFVKMANQLIAEGEKWCGLR